MKNNTFIFLSPVIMPMVVLSAYFSVVFGYSISGTHQGIEIGLAKSSRYAIHFFFLIIVVSLLYIYAIPFGGVLNWMKTAISSRLLGSDTIEAGAISFFYKIFFPASTPLMIVSLVSMLNRRSFLTVTLFTLCFLFFMVAAIGHGGRGALFFGIIQLAVVAFIFTKEIKKLYVILSFAALLFVIVLGKPLLISVALLMQGDAGEASWRISAAADRGLYDHFIDIIRYISHPSNSLAAVLTNPDAFEYRYFLDDFLGLYSILPSKLLGIAASDIPTIQQVNSSFLADNPDIGIIPGQIATWVYAFGIPGVIICGVWWGFVMRWLHDFILNSADRQVGFLGIYVPIFLYFAEYVQIGWPNHMVGNLSVYLIALVVLSPFVVLVRRRGLVISPSAS